MLKTAIKILSVVLFVTVLLGGADPLIQEFSGEADNSYSAEGYTPALGVVGTVSADGDTCPDGRPGC